MLAKPRHDLVSHGQGGFGRDIARSGTGTTRGEDELAAVVVDVGFQGVFDLGLLIGYQAGVQAANVQVEMLAAASAPINNVFFSRVDKKFLNVDIKNTGETTKSHGGSDHHSFNMVGVPGFFWEEGGRAEYGFGWHTQNDKMNLAIDEYLIQSATNSAVISSPVMSTASPSSRSAKT